MIVAAAARPGRCAGQRFDVTGELALQLFGVGCDDCDAVRAAVDPIECGGECREAFAGAGRRFDRDVVTGVDRVGDRHCHRCLGGTAHGPWMPDECEMVRIDSSGRVLPCSGDRERGCGGDGTHWWTGAEETGEVGGDVCFVEDGGGERSPAHVEHGTPDRTRSSCRRDDLEEFVVPSGDVRGGDCEDSRSEGCVVTGVVRGEPGGVHAGGRGERRQFMTCGEWPAAVGEVCDVDSVAGRFGDAGLGEQCFEFWEVDASSVPRPDHVCVRAVVGDCHSCARSAESTGGVRCAGAGWDGDFSWHVDIHAQFRLCSDPGAVGPGTHRPDLPGVPFGIWRLCARTWCCFDVDDNDAGSGMRERGNGGRCACGRCGGRPDVPVEADGVAGFAKGGGECSTGHGWGGLAGGGEEGGVRESVRVSCEQIDEPLSPGGERGWIVSALILTVRCPVAHARDVTRRVSHGSEAPSGRDGRHERASSEPSSARFGRVGRSWSVCRTR